MRKPQPRVQVRKHWESLTDAQLLELELTTDDPENLPNLVYEVPEGDEETYVEFKYDLRGTGREEEFSCVHGHHKHLAGFVMRKDKARFLVGWICGKNIYGEDFDQYTADFDAAVNRKETARRRRDIEKLTVPFMGWLAQVSQSDVFKLYNSVRGQIRERMPWIWDNVRAAAHLETLPRGLKLPATLFAEHIDPQAEFGRVVSDMSALAANLIANGDLGEKSIANIKSRLESLIRRVENVFDHLKEVEDFFQPNALQFICELANQHDNPKKRSYSSALGSITCKRTRDKTAVRCPTNYRIPNRGGLDAMKEALRVL